MTGPKVSVIVPTYRREKELERALMSLLEQKYKNFEVIVVDDNDESMWNKKVLDVVDKVNVQEVGINISYIENHPNKGSAKSRNIGIEYATGEYICFLDDDDLYLPYRISNQIEAMVTCEADYSLTDLALYSESDKLIEIRKREYITSLEKDELLKNHLMYHMTGTDTMMFTKEYLEKIGGFDHIDIGDEFYLMSKAINNGGKFIYVPVCDVKAYVHTGEGGLSSGQGKIDGENALYDYKKGYFDKLDNKAIRYIKMRHHVVLAFAYIRQKKYRLFLSEAIKGCVSDIKGSISLLLNRKG